MQKIYLMIVKEKKNESLPLSNTMGALGPMSIAIAPAPPVGLALPSA